MRLNPTVWPVLLCLLAFAMPLTAAESAEASKESAPTEQPKQTSTKGENNKNKPKDTDAKRSEAEIFIPTEGISEDFAVSFPADI